MLKTDTHTTLDPDLIKKIEGDYTDGGYTRATDVDPSEPPTSKGMWEIPEVKPCPFCGGHATTKHMRSGHVRIECPDCGATGHIYRDASFARQTWNHRIAD